MSVLARIVWLGALLSVLGCSPTTDAEVTGAADAASARPLSVTVQGSWQVTQLPLNWRRKYLPEPRPRAVAIALLGPTAEDIGSDNAPCGPPQSVVLIATSDTGQTRSKTLHKGEYCSSEWKPPSGLAWATGPRVSLESVAVAMAPNGGLELTYVVKRDAGHSDDPASNVAQRGSWKQTVSLEQIRSFLSTP